MGEGQPWMVIEGGEKDLKEILSLREVVFGETEKDRLEPKFWQWEFIEGPEGRAFIYVVKDGGKVIGHLADLPRQFSVCGEVVPGTFHLELMVHPDYRRKGIFYEMERYSVQHVKNENRLLMTACTVREKSINGLKKVGWKTVSKFPVLVYPIRFSGIVNRYIHFMPLSLLVGGMAKVIYLALFGWKEKRGKGEIEIEKVDKLDDQFDGFWQKASSLFPIMGFRNRDYLTWRYLQHPTRNYAIYRAKQSGEMRGYIVLRNVDLLSFKSAVIVDLLAMDEEALSLLVEKGIQCSRKEGIDLLGFMAPRSHSYYKTLRRNGFLPSFKSFTFLIYPHSDRAIFLSPGKWYVSWGDTDVI